MDPKIVEIVRKLTRPLVTFMLVGSLCFIAVHYTMTGSGSALEAAALMAGPSGFVLEKWFESRRRERENGGGK